MARRWAKPKENVTPGQLLLFGGAPRERPTIATRPVALGKTETSRAAASKLDAERVRRRILELIRAAGPRGMTCQECAVALGMEDGQISGRFGADLGRDNLIMRSGEKRLTRSGNVADVWVAVQGQ